MLLLKHKIKSRKSYGKINLISYKFVVFDINRLGNKSLSC